MEKLRGRTALITNPMPGSRNLSSVARAIEQGHDDRGHKAIDAE
jgi:hypothetical protein